MRRITRERAAIRPVETAAARLRWLLEMDGLFSEAAESLVMDRVDYRNQDWSVVMDDILRAAGITEPWGLRQK